jgi:hypothetical protein
MLNHLPNDPMLMSLSRADEVRKAQESLRGLVERLVLAPITLVVKIRELLKRFSHIVFSVSLIRQITPLWRQCIHAVKKIIRAFEGNPHENNSHYQPRPWI